MAVAGRRERREDLPGARAVMLRLMPGREADAVLRSRQALLRCSIRHADVAEPCGSYPRGQLPDTLGRPQAAKKPSMWRASSFPMGGQASGTVLGMEHDMSAIGYA